MLEIFEYNITSSSTPLLFCSCRCAKIL